MPSRLCLRASTGLLCGVAALAAAGQTPPLQVFTVDHESRTDSAADVRFLLDAPAGKHGFVRSIGGHLATADGRRLRLWGVNIAGWTNGSTLLPSHADGTWFAAELARLGVNAVRFQFLDLPTDRRQRSGPPEVSTPAGLIEGGRDDTRVMDPEQLDRLDYFVAQLKANGIYIDFNLNVGRIYRKGDGVPDWALIGNAKAMTYFGPRIIELEKEYARQLLTHVNPYTKTAYCREPAVAIVEILNENSLLEFWRRNWFRGELSAGSPRRQLDLTPYYKDLLIREYNEWLAATRTPAELDQLRAMAGAAPGGPVPILRRQEFDDAPKERFHAEAAFYTHLETSFLTMMSDYLKRDLGVQALVIGTNDHTYWIPGTPLLRSTSRLDVIDAHGYWHTPISTVGATPRWSTIPGIPCRPN